MTTRIGIVLRPGTDLLDERLMGLIGMLATRPDTELAFAVEGDNREHQLFTLIKNAQPSTPEHMLKVCDFVLAIGGDGTMLGVMRTAAQLQSDTNLLGINMGNVGFITEVELSDFYLKLTDILAGKFRVEKRSTVQATPHGLGPSWVAMPSIAANDILFQRNSGKLLTLKVELNDRFAYEIRADGLLISTPTGSTAYALSAGGPIIEPTCEVLLLTPLMPQNLSSRPIIVPNTTKIKVCYEPGTAEAILDGNPIEVIGGPMNESGFDVTVGPVVNYTYHAAVREDRDFTRALRNKLGWNAR